MKCSLIDAVYHPVKTPCSTLPGVVLIGRNVETGEKVLWQSSVKPYFYVEDWTQKGSNQDNLKALGVVRNGYHYLRSLNKRLLRKVVVKHPLAVDKVTRYMHKMYRAKAFEDDLAKISGLPLRYLVDHELRSGFEVKDSTLKPAEVEPVLRVWRIDFEVLSKTRSPTGPKKDEPINMVTWHDSFEDKTYTIHTHPLDFKPLDSKHEVTKVPGEKELLLTLFSKLDSQDPDVIAGHNILRYDIPKWVDRIVRHRLDLNKLSPKPFRRVDLRRGVLVKGRTLFDTMRAFIFYTNKDLRRYALDFIAEQEKCKHLKVQFKFPVSEYWADSSNITYDALDSNIKAYLEHKNITREEFRPSYIVYLRNYIDVLILREYEAKHNLIGFFNDLRITAGCSLSDVFKKWKIFDSALLRLCRGKVVLPGSKQYRGRSGGFTGAFVLEPEPGLYLNVVCLDFTRQYPSIIRACNVSPETFIAERASAPSWVEEQLEKGNIAVNDGSTGYVFKRKPKGLMVQLVDYFWAQRDKYEARELEAAKSGDKKDQEIAHSKAFQTKQILNAAFGVMSYRGFRLYSAPCSAAIAFGGRLGVEKAISYLKEKGYKVIYGDTDSVFFKLKGESKDELDKLIAELNKALNRYAKRSWASRRDPFEIALKRIYESFYIHSKKRYVGKYVWDEKRGPCEDYEWKGLEKVRTDSSELESMVQEKLLLMMLNQASDRELEKYVREVLAGLAKHEYSVYEVSYPSKIGKLFETRGERLVQYGYGSKAPAHVKAAYYSNVYLGSDWAAGDKPKRLPIKPNKIVKYPREFTMPLRSKPRTFRTKWIAIDESMEVPSEFLNAVDWSKIESRLLGKINEVLKARGIKLTRDEKLSRWA